MAQLSSADLSRAARHAHSLDQIHAVLTAPKHFSAFDAHYQVGSQAFDVPADTVLANLQQRRNDLLGALQKMGIEWVVDEMSIDAIIPVSAPAKPVA